MPQVAARASIALALAAIPAARADADVTDACIAAAEKAQTDQRDAHLRAARGELLSCSRDSCPDAIQKDCKRWLAELDAHTPTVVIHAVDERGAEVTAVRVTVDEAVLAASLDGHALAVDPGEHVFRFEGPTRSVSQRVVIREGERDRLLTVRLGAPSPGSAGKVPLGAWIVGGVGVAGVAAGAALWIRGRVERSDLYDTCGQTHSCTERAVDHARSELLGGDVAGGIGFGALGAAIIWAAVGASIPAVDAHPVVGGAVITMHGVF